MADVNANIGVNIDSSQALAQLKVLQKQISDFNLSIAKSNEAAALAQKSLQKNLLNSINSIGAFSAELRTVNTTAESFTKALENNKLSMRDYFRYAAASTKTFGQSFKAEFDTIGKVAEERVKTLQTQYIKMGRDANGAMKAIAVRPLTLDMDNLATKTQIAAQKQAIFNQLMKQGSTNLLNFGKNTQWAGRQLMVGFTLPLMAFGAAASKSFQQLETEVIKFKKVYGDLGTSKAQTDQALSNIKKLADGYTKYGVEVSKTVEVASQAAAAGFQNADLIAQTDAATKLAILGQIDQQQALQTTISLQNAFKISSTDLASTIDFLNAVENQTVTSLDDITTAIPKVAPVINSLGGDVKDLAFFLTAMKEGGVNASEGANALKSGLASLINPTKKAKDMLGGFGINVENIVTKNRGNLKATVIEFAKALDTLDPLNRAKAIETMFGKFQFARISTLLSNVTQTGNQAARVLDLAGQSAANLASLTSKELGITAESALVRFQAAMAKLRASLAPVGEVFMKAFTPIVDFVSKILDKFNHLSDGTKKAIAIVVGVIGGLGPILLMTFGLLANGVANIIKLFMTLRTGFQRLTGQSQNLGEQTAYLTSEQLDAAAAAHSLEQSHARLTQQFTAEATEVNLLRIAYQEALAAGVSFAAMNPGMMRTPKIGKFAGGTEGIISGPGTGTSDSILARVSNGEAIIPAASVARNPELVHALVSGNIPGFDSGTEFVRGPRGRKNEGTWRSVRVPGGYDISHFGNKGSLTGQQLLDMVDGEMSPVAKKIREMVNSVADGLTRSFTVFDNSVVAQLREINQDMFYKGKANIGRLRENLTGAKYAAGRDIELQRLLTEPQNGKAAVMSIQEFSTVNKKITQEITKRFAGLSDAAEMTSDELDRLIRESYDAVAKTDERIAAATQRMQQITTVTDPRTSSRLPITNDSYTKKKPLYRRGFEKMFGTGNVPYPEMTSFGITESMAAQAGKTKAEAAALYKAMSDDAKLALFALRKDIIKFGEQFIIEVNALGTEIGTTAVQAIAVGAKTKSPSEATRRTAKDIIEGLRMELAAGQKVVAQAGANVGQIAVDSIDASVVKETAKKKPNILRRLFGGGAGGGTTIVPIIEGEGGKGGKNGFGLSKGGMIASMGLMAGSMALNALPEFTGKALIQSSMNMAAMGAMFGPWGAAAGAALGLVSAGISNLLDKERKQKAMQEAVFKSSGDLATFFGNSVVDTDGSLTHFNVTLGATAIKTKELSSSFGFTSAEIKAFKELLASLPENNPLNQIITGLTNEKNPERIAKIAKAFITTQVALGQIKPDQAQKTLDLFLSASNHAGMIGSTFIGFKDQTVAVVKTLKAAASNTDAFGTALVNLIAAASNSTSLMQMKAILDGITQSGINGASALNALQLAYLGLNNTEAARGIDALRSIKGMNAANIAKVMTAVNAGLKLDLREEKGIIKDKAYVMKLANDYLKAKGTYGMQQGKADPEVQSLQAQNMSLEDKVKLLEAAKKKIDERLKKEQQISNELKRQNDYLQSQQDIEKKIIDAKLHGNYIEAALLSQQKLANTAQYNYDTKIAGMQSESDALAEKISKLKDTQDTNTTALNNLTSATNTLGTTISTWDPGKIISDTGKSKSPIPVPGTLGLDFGGVNRNLGSAGQTWSGWGKYSDRELLKKYATEMKYVPGTHFYTQTGNAKDHTLRYDEFVVLPDGNIERVKAGLRKPPGMKTGGYVKHFEPGGKVTGPGTGTSDSIPAMLSNGEYVFSAKAVQAAGGPAVIDNMHQALRAATGGHISRGRLSASHMSSSKINKEFERKLIEHGVRSLPSKVTEEMINALSGGSYKKGSLAGYQSQALALMSDRDMAFKIAHLNDVTSSLMPNWNLPYDLANQARMMKGAGRSKSFIRSMLGLSDNVYVPGKYADGGIVSNSLYPYSLFSQSGKSPLANYTPGWQYGNKQDEKKSKIVGRWISDNLLGVDDFLRASNSDKSIKSRIKSGLTGTAELGLTFGNTIGRGLLYGGKLALSPLIKGGKLGSSKLLSFISSNLAKNKFEKMPGMYLKAGETFSDKAKSIIEGASNKAIYTNMLSRFVQVYSESKIPSASGGRLAEILADPEFERLRQAAGLGKEYTNNLFNAAGHTLGMSKEEAIAYYRNEIGKIGKEVRLAKTYLSAPSSYISRIAQSGKNATGLQKNILSMFNGTKSFLSKLKPSNIKSNASRFITDKMKGINFKNDVLSIRSTLSPRFADVIGKYGADLPRIGQTGINTVSDVANKVIADHAGHIAYYDLNKAVINAMRSGKDISEVLKNPAILDLASKAGIGKEYIQNSLNAMPLDFRNPAQTSAKHIEEYFADKIAPLMNAKKGAESYLSSPLTFLSRLKDIKAGAKLASQTGFSVIGSNDMLDKFLAKKFIPQGLKNLVETYSGRTRSVKESLEANLLHPMDVPVDSGRAYGPGTYFARTLAKSNEFFSSFGNNIYKMKLSPKALLKTIRSKGYIYEKEMYERLGTTYNQTLTGMKWEDEFIQSLMKEGYIGFKHRDALTNWLVGVPGSGFKLKLTNKLPEIQNAVGGKSYEKLINAALTGGRIALPFVDNIAISVQKAFAGENQKSNGGYITPPKFHNWNGVVPGPYGEELSAVLKSGTEGVYQNDYIRGLKREALGNTTTSNANTVYNIDMTVNGGNANASEIADQVMRKIKTISSQNNKSNKVNI